MLGILHTKAQEKNTLELFFDAGTVFSKSEPIIKNTPGLAIYDPNTGTFTTAPGIPISINEYKSIPSSKFSLGIKASRKLKQNFKLYTGLSFSFLKAERKNSMSFPNFSLAGPDFRYITTEFFNFSNLDITLGAGYLYKKWSLDFEVIPSIILNSKLSKIEKPSNSEIQPILPGSLNPQDPQPSVVNQTKNFISLAIAPSYQLSNKIKIGLAYNHGLTKSYSTDKYSSDVYQSMKLRSVCLKISYKLK